MYSRSYAFKGGHQVKGILDSDSKTKKAEEIESKKGDCDE